MSDRVFEGLDPEVRNRTKTMLMYFVVFAVTMLFAGFTSAYIVSNMGQYWVHVPAPSMFWVSNVMIGTEQRDPLVGHQGHWVRPNQHGVHRHGGHLGPRHWLHHHPS